MSKFFILNLIVMMVWVAYQGGHEPLTYVLGFAIGYALIALYCAIRGYRYHIRLMHSVWLCIYFHYELLTSSLRVLWDIITPKQHSRPGFIAMELAASTPQEIFFTANLISLTPGTLSIALSEDHKTLYIHAMFIDDISETIASLKHFESVILRAFR